VGIPLVCRRSEHQPHELDCPLQIVLFSNDRKPNGFYQHKVLLKFLGKFSSGAENKRNNTLIRKYINYFNDRINNAGVNAARENANPLG
jgi:hypothetical protein